MSGFHPGSSDYVIERRSVVGDEPSWVVSRKDWRLFSPDQEVAMRVVRELARFMHCHAWLVAEDEDPTLLTLSDAAGSSHS